MTREEAIKRFEKQLTEAMVVLDSGFGTRPGESDLLYRKRKEMAEIALQALREQEERENPKPLTIEELWQMHGEPVFVTIPGKPHRSRWCIVDLCSPRPALLGKDYLCDLLVAATDAVRVYRHKPKEEPHG